MNSRLHLEVWFKLCLYYSCRLSWINNLYFHLSKLWHQIYNRLCSEWLPPEQINDSNPTSGLQLCMLPILHWVFTATMLHELQSQVYSIYDTTDYYTLTCYLTLRSHLGTAKVQQLTTTVREVEPVKENTCMTLHLLFTLCITWVSVSLKLGSTVLLAS